jgi:hypothetical protein
LPSYKFRCNHCGVQSSMYLTITQFLESKDAAKGCQECSEGSMVRDFSGTSGLSKIQRSSEDIVEDIKIEAREIADKIRGGDSKLFENIYGEDINKLKY